MNNTNIPLCAKYSCFDSIIRATISYGAEVWGYMERDCVEAVQRYFVKKLFWLPLNAPNCVVYLETGFELQYRTTFLHNET